jgi:hypothetical protein
VILVLRRVAGRLREAAGRVCDGELTAGRWPADCKVNGIMPATPRDSGGLRGGTLSFIQTMARQMIEELSPEERHAAARDVALDMVRSLSAEERMAMSAELLRALAEGLSPEQRRSAIRLAFPPEETS